MPIWFGIGWASAIIDAQLPPLVGLWLLVVGLLALMGWLTGRGAKGIFLAVGLTLLLWLASVRNVLASILMSHVAFADGIRLRCPFALLAESQRYGRFGTSNRRPGCRPLSNHEPADRGGLT
jgi:hypothetical protein